MVLPMGVNYLQLLNFFLMDTIDLRQEMVLTLDLFKITNIILALQEKTFTLIHLLSNQKSINHQEPAISQGLITPS